MTPTEWGRLQGFIGYGFINSETGEDFFLFQMMYRKASNINNLVIRFLYL